MPYLSALLLAFFWAAPAAAQNISAHPTRGHNQAQQTRDEYDCFNWVVRQAGFNPTNQPSLRRAPQGYATPPDHETQHVRAYQLATASLELNYRFDGAIAACLRDRSYTTF